VSAGKELLLDNPELFLLHYFPHRIKALKEFHLQLIDVATNANRGLILYPAAHGKTTLVSTLLPIWGLCKDPNIRIAIIGKNETDAEGIMRSIQAELTDNPELVRDFGPFKPEEDGKAWALGKLDVAKRTRRGKESTITVFGSGARTVLGHRTDWTICDDVVDEKKSSTDEQRHKLQEWFTQSVMTGPEMDSDRITVVGTLFDPKDLYNYIIDLVDPSDGSPLWEVRRVDAIVDEEEHQTLWPERWPWKRLMIEKAGMGTLSFNRRYRNVAVDPSRMVFKEEYVRGGYEPITKQSYPGCIDTNYKIGDYDPSWRRYSGFDPAVGKISRSAKFCAHMTLGVGSCRDHERCMWVIDIHRDQMTLPQQVDLIIRLHEQYGLLSSSVEANSYQMGLQQAIEQKMEEQGLAYRIEPHYTTRTNKPDPETGVQAMSPWFERGQVHIPWGDAHSKRKMQQFVDELIQYPGKTTDTVMAFWMGWRIAQVTAPKYESFNRLKRNGSEWGKRTSSRVIRNPYYVRDEEPVVEIL
jgi:hypothetical protein